MARAVAVFAVTAVAAAVAAGMPASSSAASYMARQRGELQCPQAAPASTAKPQQGHEEWVAVAAVVAAAAAAVAALMEVGKLQPQDSLGLPAQPGASLFRLTTLLIRNESAFVSGIAC